MQEQPSPEDLTQPGTLFFSSKGSCLIVSVEALNVLSNAGDKACLDIIWVDEIEKSITRHKWFFRAHTDAIAWFTINLIGHNGYSTARRMQALDLSEDIEVGICFRPLRNEICRNELSTISANHWLLGRQTSFSIN